MSATVDDAVVELARAAVARAAPEELPLFPAASEAYRAGRDPGAATRGPLLGTAAVALLTPVALAVAKEVLGLLGKQLGRQAAEHGGAGIQWLIDRLHGHSDSAAAPTPREGEDIGLTPDQLEEVRDLALEKARQLELPEAKAVLLADALVGSLATGA